MEGQAEGGFFFYPKEIASQIHTRRTRINKTSAENLNLILISLWGVRAQQGFASRCTSLRQSASKQHDGPLSSRSRSFPQQHQAALPLF